MLPTFQRLLNHRRLLFLIPFGVGTLFYASCASLTGISNDYPDGWSRDIRANDPETALSGSYENFGDHSFNPIATAQSPRAALSTVLADFPSGNLGGHSVITITYPRPGLLKFELLTDGVASQTRVLESVKDDFRVADGAIWLSTKKRQYGDGTGYVWETDSLGFRKAVDGSLVCEWRHGSAALAMWIVPLKGSQVFWMRWPLAKSVSE